MRFRAQLNAGYCALATVAVASLLFTVETRAEARVPVVKVDESLDLANKLSVWREPTASAAIQQWADRAPFQMVGGQSPGFGFTDDAIWVRFTLRNSGAAARSLILDSGSPFASSIELHERRRGQWQPARSGGIALPFYKREIRHSSVAFALNLEANTDHEFYLRLYGPEPQFVSPALYEPAAFVAMQRNRQLLLGIFFGAMGLAILYNLSLYFSIRESSYLYFVASGLLASLFVSSEFGLSYEYLWPESPWWNLHSNVFFGLTTIAAFLLFTVRFLELRQRSSFLYNLFRINIAATLLLAAAGLAIPLRVTGQLMAAAVLLNTVVIGATLVEQTKSGNRSALFFLVSFGIAIAGGIAYVFRIIGLAPNNIWTSYIMLVGFIIAFAMLTFVLGDRINRLNEERRRLLEEANQRDAQLKILAAEIEIARQIQQSILPRQSPVTNGLRVAAHYSPMGRIGGDFYDFFPVSADSLGVIVADVSGHGIPAALIAAMLKVVCAAESAHNPEPGRFLSAVNRGLLDQHRSEFVTAAYAYIDSSRGELRLANAGHPGVLQFQNGAVAELRPRGMALGIIDHAEFEAPTFSLREGDRLLMFTDGVLECESANGEHFGMRRLRDLVASLANEDAEQVCSRIVEALRLWRSPAPDFDDDITFVIIDIGSRATDTGAQYR